MASEFELLLAEIKGMAADVKASRVALEKLAAVPTPIPDPVPVPDPIPDPIPAPTADRIYAMLPAGFTLRLSDDFDKLPLGALPTTEDLLDPAQYPAGSITKAAWIAAKQPNARVDIVAAEDQQHILETAVHHVHSESNAYGNPGTGARALGSGNNYAHLSDILDKEVWLFWRARILKYIPIEQGGSNFVSGGMEGKMGAGLGTWATNIETLGGKMLPWLQNQSGSVYVYSAKEREPLPVGVWYSNALNMLMTPDKALGWQKWYYGEKTLIEAQKVATIGGGGGIGLMACLYAGDNPSVILNDDEYVMQFKDIRLYVK